jgi:hypothetical protein
MSQGIYTLLRFLQSHTPDNSILEPFQRLDRWAEPADRPWLRSLLDPGTLLAPISGSESVSHFGYHETYATASPSNYRHAALDIEQIRGIQGSHSAFGKSETVGSSP